MTALTFTRFGPLGSVGSLALPSRATLTAVFGPISSVGSLLRGSFGALTSLLLFGFILTGYSRVLAFNFTSIAANLILRV